MHSAPTASQDTIRTRELSSFAAGLLTIGSTALALLVGLLVAAGLAAGVALLAARALMDLV